MAPVMTCPECGVQVEAADDLVLDRRVHRLTVDEDDVVVDHSETVTLWRCASCDVVLGVS